MSKAKCTLDNAFLPETMFESLPEYSCSIPTGKIIGKCWKVNTTFGTKEYTKDGPWLLRCYERILPPLEPGMPGHKGKSTVLIRTRKITII